jgi:hypothetical protein
MNPFENGKEKRMGGIMPETETSIFVQKLSYFL